MKEVTATGYFGRPCLVTIGLCLAILSGCAGATRLPTRTKGPEGQAVQKKELNLSFLEANAARHDEVVNRLSSIDTGYSNRRLFWGRWSDSKWGYGWFAFGCSTAKCSNGTSDSQRVWRVHNLLVTFDENGMMQKKELISDDKVFWRELHATLAAGQPTGIPRTATVSARGPMCLTQMTLTKDLMRVNIGCKQTLMVPISPLNIERFGHNVRFEDKSHAGSTCHSLYLSEKTAVGKKISFCGGGPEVVTMFEYLLQASRSNMLWE